MKAFDEQFYEDLEGLTENTKPYRGGPYSKSSYGYTETLTDLENDPQFVEDGETYLTFLVRWELIFFFSY